jgi:uncharacterized protein YndB with AHSA1/START domain
MSARYDARGAWSYTCYGESSKGVTRCWSVSGPAIDHAVEQLFLETMVPSELDLSLAVAGEVKQQADSLEKAWRTRIEQARYEARRAERRYKAVDPDNRVVTRTLESDWEQRLHDLDVVERQYAEARRAARVELTAQDRDQIRLLARDLPAVWKSSTTSAADRKGMLRLVVEAIAVHPVDVPKRTTRIRVQWSSGAVSELAIVRGHDALKHAPEAIARISELAAAGLHDDEIAERLNAAGVRTGAGRAWKENLVLNARRMRRIARVAPDRPRMPPLPHRHPDGHYSVPGAAVLFGVSHAVIYVWIRKGLVTTSRADFGTHRDAYWLDIDRVTAVRLTAQMAKAKKHGRREE